MTHPWIADAPGKLVLIGEYSVLEGYPAVVAAIDRRARVRLEESSTWSVDAPQLGVLDQAFALDKTGSCSPMPPSLNLVEKTLGSHGKNLARCPPFRISLDTSELMMRPRGPKLGLGSSASIASSLTAVLQTHCGTSWAPSGLLAQVQDLHFRFQDRKGSGIDVAAAVLGGCLRYQMSGDRIPDNAPRRIRLPEDLHWKAVWSGSPASTPKLIEAVRLCSKERPETFSQLMRELGSLAGRGADALESRDTQSFLDSVRDFEKALGRLGDAASASIVTDAHREIADIVVSTGGVYKPSGAGGGDLGLAFASSPDILHEAEARLAQAGYPIVPLSLSEQGIRVRQDGSLS